MCFFQNVAKTLDVMPDILLLSPGDILLSCLMGAKVYTILPVFVVKFGMSGNA